MFFMCCNPSLLALCLLQIITTYSFFICYHPLDLVLILLQPTRGFFNAQSHFEIVQIIWWISGVHLINFCAWFCVEAWFEKDYLDKNMENTKKRSRNCKLVVIYLNKSHRTFVHHKVSTILIEIKFYIEIHVYSNSKTLFSINLLLAISTMNFGTLCLNYGVVTSVTIATMVITSLQLL